MMKKTGKSRTLVPPEAKVIGGNLCALRNDVCLKQTELATILDLTFQQVQKYESGANRLPIERLFFLKHFYDVPYERFFEGLSAPYVMRR